MRKNILITMMLSIGAATAANAATTTKSCTELDTNQGKIIVQLNFAKAPVTVANFEQYVSSGFYSNKIFHRVIPGFMIQGGDFTRENGTGGESIYGNKFADENFKIKHTKPNLLSMANAGPGTNGSQFFITTAATGWLLGKHTIFGEVADEVSKKVVDKIENVDTDGRDKPLDDVIIESITIEKI